MGNLEDNVDSCGWLACLEAFPWLKNHIKKEYLPEMRF